MKPLWENVFRKRKGDSLASVLKQNVLFQDLSDSEIRFLERCVHLRNYAPLEPVFRQGEVGIGLYLILSGRVEISVRESAATDGSEGREIFVTQLLAGDFFGELALVEASELRTASAVAREATAVIGFFKPDLQEILDRRPTMGTRILFRLAEVLGRRLKETTEKVTELRAALREITEPPEQERGKRP